MDLHVHMSYLTIDGFRVFAKNYLDTDEHWRFEEIEELIKTMNVTPAEVAEELMKSDDADVSLEGLLHFLKTKNNGQEQEQEQEHELNNSNNNGGEIYFGEANNGKEIQIHGNGNAASSSSDDETSTSSE